MSGFQNEAEGYAASLRQQAAWIDNSRYTEDLDADELRAAADFIETLPGWQPIETAPKDGTPIEVCNTRHPSHAPVIVQWTDEGLSEDLPEPHWCDAATADGSALYFNQNYFDFWKPTTTLPAPPVHANQGAGR